VTTLDIRPPAIRQRPLPTMRTVEDIVQVSEDHGSYFFSPSTMEAFRSELDDETFVADDGTYFITSEQQSGDFWRVTGMGADLRAMGATEEELEAQHPREWSVRRARVYLEEETGEHRFTVSTFGDFGAFQTRAEAASIARLLAFGDHKCAVCGGELMPGAWSGWEHKDGDADHDGVRVGNELEAAGGDDDDQ